VLLRHERRGRRVQPSDDRVDVQRHRRDDLAGQTQRRRPLVQAEEQAEINHQVEFMRANSKWVTTPKLPPRRSAQNKSGCLQDSPVGCDDLRANQVVDAQPELAGQPAHAEAELIKVITSAPRPVIVSERPQFEPHRPIAARRAS
jgi:hypothetical protein